MASKAPVDTRDSSPIALEGDQGEWLARLVRAFRPADLRISLGGHRVSDEEPLAYWSPDGRWMAGRYVGDVWFEGRRLRITPRFGLESIERWLEEALNLLALPAASTVRESESFLARLLAAVWCRSVADASRHGPPALRREQRTEGSFARGRLDARHTAQLRTRATPGIASVARVRDLENDVSRAMVAAERTLTRLIGRSDWHTPRVAEILPRLHEAVGRRIPVPSERALARIRYAPITRGYKRVTALSAGIARTQGMVGEGEGGRVEGLLVDMAELWELFVLNVCRHVAAHGQRVEHGTAGSDLFLLTGRDERQGLGRLKPDVVIREPAGRVTAVIDAKYKRLADRWPDRPRGVDRADVYQLATYLSRLGADGNAQGALLYPLDPEQDELAAAEKLGPWRMPAGNVVHFVRVPTAVEEARRMIGRLVESVPTTAGVGSYP